MRVVNPFKLQENSDHALNLLGLIGSSKDGEDSIELTNVCLISLKEGSTK